MNSRYAMSRNAVTLNLTDVGLPRREEIPRFRSGPVELSAEPQFDLRGDVRSGPVP